MNLRRSIYRATVAFVLVALGALQGCADEEASQGIMGPGGQSSQNPSDEFISDAPGRTSSDMMNDSSGAASGAGGGSSNEKGAGNDKDKGEEDTQKVIEEADILQIRGARLYALSRSSGLSIIDISNADHLKMMGRYPLSGEPFEMYVKDNIVFAMFSSWGRYECEEDSFSSCKWVSSSHIAALDAADPKNLVVKGTFDLPGEISDSRIVGDVLYAVSYENGYCWNCSDKPNTTVTSLSLKDLQHIVTVDRVTYENENNSYGWGRRSISVNDKRIYIAGVEWNSNGWEYGHSTIQVVDISNPSGKMEKGASVEAEGQIESRWQMDEYNGILRVISQPGQWNTSESPKVQTFQVESSQKLTPLANVDIKLPKPERLRSVRFDKNRAFAITAVQTDPLFTFDLSDPAEPKQLGELEMPGWIYHMEPRGDRLLALGFDNQSKEGSLNVSLFDVSDLSNPTMLQRVSFGGNWGQFAEDQDRIHKAFSILEDEKLILVPFSGWEPKQQDSEWWGCGNYKSGIQLIDYNKDSLAKRGVAPQRGQARRAFLKDNRLFSLSDDKLRTFDITDRDAPKMKSEVNLAHKVNRTVSVGDKLVRLNTDWWTGEASLDVVLESDAENPESLGTLDLSSYTGKDSGGCYGSSIYGARIFTHENTLIMVWRDSSYYGYSEGSGDSTSSGGKTYILTIDVSNASTPKVLGFKSFPFLDSSYYYNYGGDSFYYNWKLDNSEDIVQAGTTLAIRRNVYPTYNNGNETTKDLIEFIDLKDPANPVHASTLDITGQKFQIGLQVADGLIVTSHAEAVPDQPGKVRFYLDRVDVSNAFAPQVLPKINIPGSLLNFDASTGNLVSVDYKKTVTSAKDWSDCYGSGYYSYNSNKWFESNADGTGTCFEISRTLRLVHVENDSAKLLDSQSAEQKDQWLRNIVFEKDRFFGLAVSSSSYDAPSKEYLMVFDGLNGGKFERTEIPLQTQKTSYYGNYNLIGAYDNQAVLMNWSDESTVFTVDPSASEDERQVKRGTLLTWSSEVRLAGDKLIAALYERGVQVIPLK